MLIVSYWDNFNLKSYVPYFFHQAIDDKQNEAITSTSNELAQRKGYLEENLKLAHDLKVSLVWGWSQYFMFDVLLIYCNMLIRFMECYNHLGNCS